jgi:hypothetical protein
MRAMRRVLAFLVVVAAAASTRASAAELEITAGESTVRTAPFDVAPLLTRLHAGDRLTGEADAQNGWFSVSLPDGRHGFVHAADARALAAPRPAPVLAAPAPTEAVPTAAPAAELAVPPRVSASPAVVVASAATAGAAHVSALLGVMFELLPVGSLSGSSNGKTVTNDTQVTVALAPFLDIPLSPWIELGASPQFVFKVKTDGAAQSTTEYDLRARLTARDPVTPQTNMFFRFSPGYSILSLPAGSLPAGTSGPGGPWIDFAVGSEITVAPGLVLVVDVGYQLGFQSVTFPDSSSADTRTQFVHLGVGMALGL